MALPNRDVCKDTDGIHNLPTNDANRLQKLEDEVCRLRNDVDKMKWQKAAAETAIERAIVRGATALGGRYKIHMPVNTDNESIGSKKKLCRNETEGSSDDNVKGNKPVPRHCGQYTLG